MLAACLVLLSTLFASAFAPRTRRTISPSFTHDVTTRRTGTVPTSRSSTPRTIPRRTTFTTTTTTATGAAVHDSVANVVVLHLSSSSSSSFTFDDGELAKLLQARQEQLQRQQDALHRNWKTAAACESKLAVLLPAGQWVRRVTAASSKGSSSSSCPLLVAAGSASDAIFVAHAETGDIVAQSKRSSTTSDSGSSSSSSSNDGTATPMAMQNAQHSSVLRMLYGPYDGGGTIAIAMKDNLIVSAGRRGSVQIHRLDVTSNTLVFQGNMQALEGVLVTCLALPDDDDHLWIGTADGRVLAFEHHCNTYSNGDDDDDDAHYQQQPLSLQTEAVMSFRAEPVSGKSSSSSSSSPVLALAIDSSIGLGVFATAQGSVELFSTQDHHRDNCILASWYPPFDSSSGGLGRSRQSSNVYPLAVALVPGDLPSSSVAGRYDNVEQQEQQGTSASSNLPLSSSSGTATHSYYMACGASDGSIHLQALNVDQMDNELDILHPLVGDVVECLPRHQGAVKCLASPKPGLFMSGGQDGAIRMWNVDDGICQYQFLGYKVWLGSLWTDGIRLVSDGADNAIVVHDFECRGDDGGTSGSSD